MEVLRAEDSETWHRLCSETFVPLDSVTGEAFTGQIENVRMEGVSVSRVTCQPCRVGRSPGTIKLAPRPDVLVNLLVRGRGLLRAESGSNDLNEGQAALCEADAEYHLELATPVTVLTLQLDRSLLPIADARIRLAHGVPIQSKARVTVLSYFMQGLLEGGGAGLDRRADYGSIARDLLLLALHEHDDIASSAEVDAGYVLMRSFLERHFTDPDLSVDLMTRRLRVSRRYAESAFARHDLSPAAFLRTLRLTRAQAILAGSTSSTVAEAARLAGFSDPATFRRAFRRATGLSPDSWRQHRRLEADELSVTSA